MLEVMLELGVPSGSRWDHALRLRKGSSPDGMSLVTPLAWAAEDSSCLSSSSGEQRINPLGMLQCLMPVT